MDDQAGAVRLEIFRADPHEALRHHLTLVVHHLDRVVGLEAPVHRGDAGSEQRAAAARSALGGRRRRRGSVRTNPRANAIHTLRAGRRSVLGRTVVPIPGVAATASATTPCRSAAAMTVRTPDQAAILRGGDLRGHAAAPPVRTGPAGELLELLVDLDDLLDQRGVGVAPRVGGEHARPRR